MNQPTASIVIPSYNHSRFIAECVSSACQQSYPKTNVYVVDDGSTDESLSILNELIKQYSFKVFSLPHQGLISTLNWAIQNLDLGEYVTFLGSDDLLPPERIAIQVDGLQKNPQSALVYGNYTEITEEGLKITYVRCLHPKKNFFSELLLSNFIAAPTTLIRTDVLRKLGGFDEKFKIEDWALWLKLSKDYPVLFLDQNLAFYRTHPYNQHKNIDVVHSESLRLLDEYRHEKNYDAAACLAHCKYIAKSFLISYKIGLKNFRLYFKISFFWHLTSCFLLGRGPFRKFRLRYFYEKYVLPWIGSNWKKL